MKNWGFAQVWNNSLLERKERPTTPRDRIWASELGKGKLDVYLKMKGVEPTNPPNARSLRKFEAGNIWEWVVELILKRSGILQEAQRWTMFQYPGLLPVSGKLDFVAGGKPDYEKAEDELSRMELPEIFLKAGKNIITYFKENYPDGMDNKILEVKSTSSFMFESIENNVAASKNHRLQLFHYLKSENMEKGEIVYVCKDDCRMIEIPVLNPSPVEDEYKKSIEEITYYFNKNEQPPKEPELIWDPEFLKFSKNWNVAYSGYLTKVYGFKDQKEFDDTYSPMVGKFNRVIERVKQEKDMTKLNLEVLEDIKGKGFNLEEIKSQIKQKNGTV